jgi:hypothetical protein
MKTEHTQGPWKALEHARGNKRTCVTTANGAPVHAVICEIDTKSVATDDATRLANARLIASAPELLAELHSVLVQLEAQALGYSAPEIWPHVRTEIVRRISDAINKAEGNA